MKKSLLLFVSMFTKDDLPTLLRPINAISLKLSLGTCEIFSELHLNFALIEIAIVNYLFFANVQKIEKILYLCLK